VGIFLLQPPGHCRPLVEESKEAVCLGTARFADRKWLSRVTVKADTFRPPYHRPEKGGRRRPRAGFIVQITRFPGKLVHIGQWWRNGGASALGR
jgi:hypothetical protein